MQIFYRFLSTVSGKSVILQAGPRKYAFNMFEGFQRYCIESQLSMCSLDAVFLPDRYSVPALVGAYLSMGETAKEELAVVTEDPVDMGCVHEFAQPQKISLKFSREYKDECLEVSTVLAAGKANYLIRFPKIRGRFFPERVPSAIPKRMYKLLSQGERVRLDGVEYDGRDYTDCPIDLGCVCVVFSDEDIEHVLARCGDATIFICMSAAAARHVVHGAADRGATVYYVKDMSTVEYTGLYEIQKKMNAESGSYLLPCAYRVQPDGLRPAHHETCGLDIRMNAEKALLGDFPGTVLANGDSIEFNRSRGYVLARHTNTEYLDVTNQPVYPGVIFLGTGCSVPSKYRNVSSILYENGCSSVLIDCGEDTLSQILRVYGNLKTLEKLRVIYLSHSHADHVLGVAAVLRLLAHRITIVGPRGCRAFIESYFPSGAAGHDYVETDGAKAQEQSFYRLHGVYKGRSWLAREPSEIEGFIRDIEPERFAAVLEIGEFEFRICGCLHSTDSTSAVILDRAAGKQVAYSGDTSPSVLFSALATGSDLLIHEASFKNDQAEFAVRTNHSTEEEAFAVYRYSKARSLLLTHFSNRNGNLRPEKFVAVDFYRFVFD